jgi:hypothetical protein
MCGYSSDTRRGLPVSAFPTCSMVSSLMMWNDPELGEAIAPDTYDYAGTMLWNWHAPGLWNRFTVELVRVLAAPV